MCAHKLTTGVSLGVAIMCRFDCRHWITNVNATVASWWERRSPDKTICRRQFRFGVNETERGVRLLSTRMFYTIQTSGYGPSSNVHTTYVAENISNSNTRTSKSL